MSETIVERVKSAIRTELRNQGVLWEDDPHDGVKLMMQTGEAADLPALVRAILTAMREPTEAMLPSDGVAAGTVNGMDHYLDRDEAAFAWRAMIDAALAEAL